jgi:hypothetical protein
MTDKATLEAVARAVDPGIWTHWMPLPEPPEGADG